MKSAFLLGRSLTRRQKAQLGFVSGATPCHATLTETLRVIDACSLADALGSLYFEENGDARHIAIDGKTMRASKDGEGKAEHVLSAFCGGLQTVLSHESSRGKGLEILDALKLLERLDLKGKVITRSSVKNRSRRKSSKAAAIMFFPSKTISGCCETMSKRLSTSRLFPLAHYAGGVEKAHG